MTHLSTINPNLRSLAVIARVLDYPCTDLQEAADAMVCVIRDEGRIPAEQRQSLMDFIRRLRDTELLDIQADYVETFDRGRAVSLLLFEHVHGESRARGQAMVDLLAQYHNAGLELDARELPDYFPLYLQFLATCDEEAAASGLGDVHPILALISARLQERHSNYHLLFDALLSMIGIEADMPTLRKSVAKEARDDTPAAMDKVWEEEMVTFIEDQGQTCSHASSPPETHTLHFRENPHVLS